MHQAQAFIAMPFDQKFYTVYKTIRAACESLNIKVIRIDEVWAREDIYKQIEEEILKSDFMIADFTGDRMMEVPNPNVVHEAAFARTKKKYLILMAQDHKCLPFDWRTRPAIIYQMTPEGLSYLEERLVLGIKALMEKDDFGRDYEEATTHGFVGGYPPQMPQYMPVGYAPTTMNYAPPTNNTSLSEIESILISKQAQPVAVNSNHSSRLPKGFSKKKDRIVCRIDDSEMVHIPAAEFTMGFADEEPEHQVVLSEYLIDKYPVTNRQFAKFMESGGYQFQGFWSDAGWQWRVSNSILQPAFWNDEKFNHPDCPVVGISWYEAMAYAAWTGKHLPTEAQWEFAAKGTGANQFPWGNEEPCSEKANYRAQFNRLTPVNQFESVPSEYGCIDMAGNAWEWCYDWYDDDYYENSPRENPLGPGYSSDEEKVCRGGAWTYDVDTLKVYHRFFGIITLRDKSSGFRCARIL